MRDVVVVVDDSMLMPANPFAAFARLFPFASPEHRVGVRSGSKDQFIFKLPNYVHACLQCFRKLLIHFDIEFVEEKLENVIFCRILLYIQISPTFHFP